MSGSVWKLSTEPFAFAGNAMAYFAWHRLNWDHNLCRGINARRMCSVRWYNPRLR